MSKAEQDKQARLAAALRENLKKRKDQSRERECAESVDKKQPE